MYLAIDGVEIAAYPIEFQAKVMDLDNAETTVRTADGTLSRDRITVKRQIEISWNALQWEDVSAILQAMSGQFFELTYPDPMTGQQETKSFYVGDRQAPIAINKNGVYWWGGLQMTLTEK